MQNLSDWLDYILSLHHTAIDLGLDRIQQIAAKLELTHFDCPVITVAGTNGKGSVVRTLETIYHRAGYKTAAYTSPHLHAFNERARINNSNVTDEQLVDAFTTIENARDGRTLSFFEFTTLAIFYLFQQQRELDVVILEVGLGGRLDAVNLVDCDIAVISNIALDHCEWLGNTRESIAREKAGIIRKNKPIVYGEADMPDAIANIAKQHDAPLYKAIRDFEFKKTPNSQTSTKKQKHDDARENLLQPNHNWTWHSKQAHLDNLPHPSLKPENVSTALMVVELLQPQLPTTPKTIRNALAELSLPGRFECHDAHDATPVVVYDVAHNPQAAEWLATQLERRYPDRRWVAVWSTLADKDREGVIRPLLPLIDRWYLAEVAHPRAAGLAELRASLAALGVKSWYNAADVGSAMQAAKDEASTHGDTGVVVYGSFHTVSEARSHT